jgi:hypothetical protein
MKSKPTTTDELAQRLANHLIKHGVDPDTAYRRVAQYYDLGGARGSSQHP